MNVPTPIDQLMISINEITEKCEHYADEIVRWEQCIKNAKEFIRMAQIYKKETYAAIDILRSAGMEETPYSRREIKEKCT